MSGQPTTTAPLHTQILSAEPASQSNSPLFGVLPAEVREHIFAYALTDYPDPSPERRYEPATCYTRPSYFAPRRSDTSLLMTCRAAYAECWFLPFVLREQVHWLTNPNRAPPEYRGTGGLGVRLRRIAARLGEERIEIAGLRVFAQMWKIEGGGMSALMSTAGLHPRILTLTIRHTDWWFWETDEPLRFEAGWLRGLCRLLPSSVREVRIELESTVRRKEQVDMIAKQMGEKWFFVRTDERVLYADATGAACEVSTWRGTSTWHGERWQRDETDPGVIDYHVVSVPFRLEHVVERRGGRIREEAKQAGEACAVDGNAMRLDCRERGQASTEQSGQSSDEENWYESEDDEDGWNDSEEDEESQH